MNKFVQIGDFILDVVLNEDHRLASDVTEFPVEDGGTLSDNIRPKPIEISIEGVVTNHPLPSNEVTQLAVAKSIYSQPDPTANAVVSAVGSVFGALVGSVPTIQHLRSDKAYAYLRGIYTLRSTVTIRTSLGVFTDMALEEFTTRRDSNTGDALKFTASFKQIQIVSSERVFGTSDGNRGHQSGFPNIEGKVLWKRGIQPGGPVIYDTRYVTMKLDKTAKTVRWWYVAVQPVNLAAIVFTGQKTPAGSVGNTEVSGFFSIYGREENRPLSDREVFWLQKDLARDAAARKAKLDEAYPNVGTNENTLFQTQRDREAAKKARSYLTAPSNPYDPDIFRRPIQDPSKLQRSVMKEQGDGQDPTGNISSKRPLNTDALRNSNSTMSSVGRLLP